MFHEICKFYDTKICFHTFDDDSFSIWKAVLPQFIEKGMVTGQISSEPWIDVGTLDRLKLANSVYNEN